MTVATICVCTYQRPVGLARFLNRLAETQPDRFVEVDGEQIELALVIADNEPHGPRRELVEEFAEKWPGSVTYAVEPRRGIAQARNRAVAAALPAADFVIFADDDEVPEPDWIQELFRMQHRRRADVVVGPVAPRFEEAPPQWVVQGRFFERPRYPDGEHIHYAWTSNVLVRKETFAVADPPFNERLGLNGGEDTFFFQQVNRAGHRIVWADHALVSEYVPKVRCATGWLLRREYRRGNTLSLCLVEQDPSLRRRFKRVGHAALAAAEGVGMLLLAPLRGKPVGVKGAQRICFAGGLISGLLGFMYEEYKRTNGE